jgi:hypothetical protein
VGGDDPSAQAGEVRPASQVDVVGEVGGQRHHIVAQLGDRALPDVGGQLGLLAGAVFFDTASFSVASSTSS